LSEITVIIADDHPLIRSGIRTELEASGICKVIGEAENGIQAFELINRYKPDIAVLDFEMPGLNGIEIAEKLLETDLWTKILLLTIHNEIKIFMKATECGIQGYILKDDALDYLVRAIKIVTSGGTFISPKITKLVMDSNNNVRNDPNIGLLKKLTEAEKKILILVSELKSNDEIAELLYISRRTVENQKGTISQKLGLGKSRELLKFSIKYKDYFTEK